MPVRPGHTWRYFFFHISFNFDFFIFVGFFSLRLFISSLNKKNLIIYYKILFICLNLLQSFQNFVSVFYFPYLRRLVHQILLLIDQILHQYLKYIYPKHYCNDKCVFVYDYSFIHYIHLLYISEKFNERSHREDNNVQLFNRWLTHNMYRGSERLVTRDIYKC